MGEEIRSGWESLRGETRYVWDWGYVALVWIIAILVGMIAGMLVVIVTR